MNSLYFMMWLMGPLSKDCKSSPLVACSTFLLWQKSENLGTCGVVSQSDFVGGGEGRGRKRTSLRALLRIKRAVLHLLTYSPHGAQEEASQSQALQKPSVSPVSSALVLLVLNVSRRVMWNARNATMTPKMASFCSACNPMAESSHGFMNTFCFFSLGQIKDERKDNMTYVKDEVQCGQEESLRIDDLLNDILLLLEVELSQMALEIGVGGCPRTRLYDELGQRGLREGHIETHRELLRLRGGLRTDGDAGMLLDAILLLSP